MNGAEIGFLQSLNSNIHDQIKFWSVDLAKFNLAVVGAGPAGLFLIEKVLRDFSGSVSVSVFEKLPTPFGLIRYGVAGDHLGTKAITRVLSRVLQNERVNFVGNTEIGKDIGLSDLESYYHAVVLATGVGSGRNSIPIIDPIVPVAHAFDVAQWANGYPDMNCPFGDGSYSNIGIVGNGNVALDIARLLLSSRGMNQNSDIPTSVLKTFARFDTKNVQLFGRGSIGDTRFSMKEFKELLEIEELGIHITNAENNSPSPRSEELSQILSTKTINVQRTKNVEFHFECENMRFENRNLRFKDNAFSLDALVLATGQVVKENFGLPIASDGYIENKNGVVVGKDNIFVAGWAGKFAQGDISTNRKSSHLLATKIFQAREFLMKLKKDEVQQDLSLPIERVTWEGWQNIDLLEVERGKADNRPREKFVTKQEFLSAANDSNK